LWGQPLLAAAGLLAGSSSALVAAPLLCLHRRLTGNLQPFPMGIGSQWQNLTDQAILNRV
jgi:hypothetical protein